MKFGKIFKLHIQETVPGWRDKLLSYKELKKLVRLIPNGGNAEAEFLDLLNNEIEKLIAFFLETEEDFIIRHQELKERMKRAIDIWGPNGSQPSETDYMERTDMLIKDIVDLHGEMVRLTNYCSINYTGLAKILKKYDKKTGGLRRIPFIQRVLEQPFFTSELISKLVRECESIIDEMLAKKANEPIVLDGEE